MRIYAHLLAQSFVNLIIILTTYLFRKTHIDLVFFCGRLRVKIKLALTSCYKTSQGKIKGVYDKKARKRKHKKI